MLQIEMTEYEAAAGQTAREAEKAAGELLLLFGLRAHFGVATDAAQLSSLIARGEHGKPYLRGFPEIHFNISHSHGVAACAFCDIPVGLDIEKIRPFRDGLLSRVLAEEERSVFEAVATTEELRREWFYRFWTAKEAALKLDGLGLSRDPREITFVMRETEYGPTLTSVDPALHCSQKIVYDNYLLSAVTRPAS